MSTTQASKKQKSSTTPNATSTDSIQDPLIAPTPAMTSSSDTLASSTSGVQGLSVPMPGILQALTTPSAVTAVNSNFDWSQHPARPVIVKRAQEINNRYPDIDVSWVVDWVRDYIRHIYSDSEDSVFQALANSLASRLNTTNPNPSAEQGGAPPQKGLSGGTGTQLWTGGADYKPAQKKAGDRANELLDEGQEAGSVESTLAGELMDSLMICKSEDSWSPKTDAMWTALSKQFAANARGDVEVHTLFGIRNPSVFYTTESEELIKVFTAQEMAARAGLPVSTQMLTSVQMHIYMRKGQEQEPITNRWRLKAPPDLVEELVLDRTESISNSQQLKAKKSASWNKEESLNQYFAVVPG